MAFSWLPKGVPEKLPLVARIQPEEILYDFDGPILFTAMVNGYSLLCYKIEDDGDQSQYIIAPSSNAILDALKSGFLSLRTALLQPWIWIVIMTCH